MKASSFNSLEVLQSCVFMLLRTENNMADQYRRYNNNFITYMWLT